MIKDFLIINCTGKNDFIGLKIKENFITHSVKTDIKNNNLLVINILDFIEKNNVKINREFSIIINKGPGKFSSIRAALSVAKGIKISKGAEIYGYKDSDLDEFNLKNIEFLIKKNLLENKLINPLYLS